MLTHKHKARIRAYIKSINVGGKLTKEDISDLVKKKFHTKNPDNSKAIDDFLSTEGLPPSDGRKVHVIEE